MADVTLSGDQTPTRSGRGLRVFDFALSAMLIALSAGTALLLPFLIAQSLGHGTISVEGVIDVPYSFSVAGGPTMEVGADGSTSTVWDGPADDQPYEGVRPASGLRATIDLDDGDVDARVIVGGAIVCYVVASWIGLLNLRRVVRSALTGNPFDVRNVGRLRWCAVAALSAPVTGWIMARLFEIALDPSLAGAKVDLVRPDWGVYVLVGLGLLALAEVFRVGETLQDLERSTI